MNTRDVIYTYYKSTNEGDWDTWLSLFANDVVVDEQLAGHVEGIAALQGAVDAIKKGYSKFLMHPLHIIVEEGDACVIWQCEAANATGVPINSPGANYFQVKDGKITYMANFHDSVPFAPFTNQKLD